MYKYVILAESGADLPKEMIVKHPIYVAPMHIEVDNKDYLDGSIAVEELCEYYNRTGKVPKTSAANPHDYQLEYEKIASEHPDAIIIHICYSSLLSATYQNSLIPENCKNQIFHVDSLNVSIGQAFIVMKTISLIEKNPNISPEELVGKINKYAANTKFSFIPGNLDYLRAGGRVSNAQYLGASLMRLKPMIELLDGKMISTKKYLGSMKRTSFQMINDFFTRFNMDKNEVYIIYSVKIDEAFKSEIDKHVRTLGVSNIVWFQTGGVITSHAGPGALGIAGMEQI